MENSFLSSLSRMNHFSQANNIVYRCFVKSALFLALLFWEHVVCGNAQSDGEAYQLINPRFASVDNENLDNFSSVLSDSSESAQPDPSPSDTLVNPALAWSGIYNGDNASPGLQNLPDNGLKLEDLRVISEVGGIMPIRGVSFVGLPDIPGGSLPADSHPTNRRNNLLSGEGEISTRTRGTKEATELEEEQDENRIKKDADVKMAKKRKFWYKWKKPKSTRIFTAAMTTTTTPKPQVFEISNLIPQDVFEDDAFYQSDAPDIQSSPFTSSATTDIAYEQVTPRRDGALRAILTPNPETTTPSDSARVLKLDNSSEELDSQRSKVAIQFDKTDFDTFILTRKSKGGELLQQQQPPLQPQLWDRQPISPRPDFRQGQPPQSFFWDGQQPPQSYFQDEQPGRQRPPPGFNRPLTGSQREYVQKFRHDLYVHHQSSPSYIDQLVQRLASQIHGNNNKNNNYKYDDMQNDRAINYYEGGDSKVDVEEVKNGTMSEDSRIYGSLKQFLVGLGTNGLVLRDAGTESTDEKRLLDLKETQNNERSESDVEASQVVADDEDGELMRNVRLVAQKLRNTGKKTGRAIRDIAEEQDEFPDALEVMETLEEIWGLHNETEEAVTSTGAGKTVSVRRIPASYLLLFKISQPQQQTGGGMKLRSKQRNLGAAGRKDENIANDHFTSAENKKDDVVQTHPDYTHAASTRQPPLEAEKIINFMGIDEENLFRGENRNGETEAETENETPMFVDRDGELADEQEDEEKPLGDPQALYSFGFSLRDLPIDQILPTDVSPLLTEGMAVPIESLNSTYSLNQILAVPQENDDVALENNPLDNDPLDNALPSIYENPFLDKMQLGGSVELQSSEKDTRLNENIALANVLNNNDYEVISKAQGKSRDGRNHFNDISNSVDVSLKRYKGNTTQTLVLSRNEGEDLLDRVGPTFSKLKDADDLEATSSSDVLTTEMSESRSLKALIQTPLTTPLPFTTFTVPTSQPENVIVVKENVKGDDASPTMASLSSKKKPRRKTFFHPIQRKPLARRAGVEPSRRFTGNSNDVMKKIDRIPLLRKPKPSFPFRRMPIRKGIPSAAPMRFLARKVEPSVVAMAAQRYPHSPGASSMMPQSDVYGRRDMNDGPVVEVGPFPLGSGSGLGMAGMGKTNGFGPSAGGIQSPQNGMGNINQMSNMMQRAGASQAGVRSLPGSVWSMASRMAGGGGSSSPWNQLPRQALMRGVGNPWKTYGNVQGQQQQSQLMRNVGMRGMGRRGGMAVRGMGAGMGNAGGMFG